MDFEKYLTDRYRPQIEWYDTKSARNKTFYYIIQWSVIAVSAVIPVLISSLPVESKWITILLSIILAIGTAGLKTFKFQENWINYRTIAESLKKEFSYLQAGIGDYQNSDNKSSLFVERVESLISRENTLWITIHQEKEKPESAK